MGENAHIDYISSSSSSTSSSSSSIFSSASFSSSSSPSSHSSSEDDLLTASSKSEFDESKVFGKCKHLKNIHLRKKKTDKRTIIVLKY